MGVTVYEPPSSGQSVCKVHYIAIFDFSCSTTYEKSGCSDDCDCVLRVSMMWVSAKYRRVWCCVQAMRWTYFSRLSFV
jgi:hypothetical protein